MDEPPNKRVTLNVDYADASISQSNSKLESSIEEFKSPGLHENAVPEDDLMDEDLKIVHLTDECLEKIFRYLNLTDLTNSAEANVRLAGVAKTIFAQVHQNHRLFLKSRGDLIQIAESHPLINAGSCSLSCTVIENMFKHFGKYIRRIKVFHALSDFQTAPNFNMVYHIAQHCNETLEELELFGSTAFGVMRYYQKSFKRLERLVFCEIVTRLSRVDNLNDMFPNLRTLEFHNVFHVFESFAVEQRFPHLENLAIFTFPYTKFDQTYIPAIRKIAHLNPQLRGIGLYDMKSTLNDFSLDTMPNIERLEIGGRLVYPRSPFDFGNVRSLKLIYSNTNDPNIIEWHNLPPQLEQLEVIGYKMNDRLITLINQCQNLKSLKIMSFGEVDLKCVERLTENSHQIEEVEFISKFKENSTTTNAFSAALVFIQRCNTLRKATATILVDKSEARYQINKWHYTSAEQHLVAYREKLKSLLVFDWWRWSFTYHVKIVDFLKGWQRGPCFSASIIKSHVQQ